MLTNTTITKLNEMRLSARAESLRGQMQNIPSSLSFEERFGLVVDAEWARRKSNQLSRLIKKATLRSWDLIEIIEARHQNASAIFISQFSPEGWHEKIGEHTMADAILDRIVHNSYHICTSTVKIR